MRQYSGELLRLELQAASTIYDFDAITLFGLLLLPRALLYNLLSMPEARHGNL